MPTILVADDNSNIQKMVTLALKSEGIDVVAVGNGEAAVKKAVDINPDLVLADIFMPVRSGYEVCEFLKNDSRFSHVPVVLLAGVFEPFDEREAQRVGADGVLKKPFVPPDPLVALVKELLAKSSGHLVGVSVPAQTAAPVQNSPASTAPAVSPGAPAAEASAPSAIATPTFAPPASVPSAMSAMAQETVEDEMNDTVVAPIRDFMTPSAEIEPENGGAIPFASMLETTSLESEIPGADAAETSEMETGPKPAGAHSAFEGFTAWRAGAADVAAEDEVPTVPSNQYMPSTSELMGRVWEVDPSLAGKSPDETVIESSLELSPLTHSVAHTTSVRDDIELAEQPVEATESGASELSSEITSPPEAVEPEPAAEPRVSDWRSVFHVPPPPATETVARDASSLSPWGQFPLPSAEAHEDVSVETAGISEPEAHGGNDSTVSSDATFGESGPSAYSGTPSIDYSDVPAATMEPASPAAQSEIFAAPSYLPEHEASSPNGAGSNSHASDTASLISSLPSHLSPEDTTTIARSLVEELAPAAVQSVATSFPVPTGAPADSRVVEDVVARVVERMQPQILEIITREVLRPVVEALVRRQLEQKPSE